jgi:uncharacterized membrane protein YvlD (DUF360 family)
MIKSLIRAYLINLFALWATSQLISGFHLAEGAKSLLLVAGGFTLLYLIVRPILQLFLGAFNFITFGLIGLVIDSGLLYALTLYFPQISISSWYFPGLVNEYLNLPSYEFNAITTTVIAAFIINVIRSSLTSLASS